MHRAFRLELSVMVRKAVSRYTLLEERHLSWAEDEARAVWEALHCLPKTTPSRLLSRVEFDP